MSRAHARLLSVCLSLPLALAPGRSWAGPGPDAPVEGPASPTRASPGEAEGDAPTSAGAESPPADPPAPSLPPPSLAPITGEGPPGIELAVPPPGPEQPSAEQPSAEQPAAVASYELPDPGMAPSDGVNMLVLGGTTSALTIAGFTAALVLGLDQGVELEWLLPSTIVPAVGLLAFSAGGLYLGAKRARAYRRWEIGYRVIGLPQGGGLLIGGSFTLLAALGLIPSGAVIVDQQPELGAALIGVGAAAAVATPVMFVLGARNQRRYLRTGGWKRKPLPPMPPSVQLTPVFVPLRGGAGVGAAGRF